MEKPSEDTLRQFSQLIEEIYGVRPYDTGFKAGEKAGALKALKEFEKRADESVEKQKREFAIEELKKLMGTMVQNMQIISGEFGDELTNEQELYNDGLRKGIELLSEKLSELKGE